MPSCCALKLFSTKPRHSSASAPPPAKHTLPQRGYIFQPRVAAQPPPWVRTPQDSLGRANSPATRPAPPRPKPTGPTTSNDPAPTSPKRQQRIGPILSKNPNKSDPNPPPHT